MAAVSADKTASTVRGFVVDRHYLEIEFPLEENRHG